MKSDQYTILSSQAVTYAGVDFGAQTIANDSGNILWKAEWVCRSTEDMKPSHVDQHLSRRTREATYSSERDVYVSSPA